MPLLLKFARKALTNVDDAAGRWQFEGGSVTQDNKEVANYASFKRVTYKGTDQDSQNTASVTTTIFFVGAHPPESITLEGAHDFHVCPVTQRGPSHFCADASRPGTKIGTVPGARLQMKLCR